jgi:hypothetical protein
VALIVTALPDPPVANAGDDQVVYRGDTVQLDGSGSHDPDQDALSYQWTLTSRPEGSSAELSGPTTPTPSFIADLSGAYTFQLEVSAGTDSDTDTVLISAEVRMVSVPDLVDATVTDAETTLAGAYLNTGSVTIEYNPSIQADRVISQDPAPGVVVEAYTPVNYVVSLGAEPAELSAHLAVYPPL